MKQVQLNNLGNVESIATAGPQQCLIVSGSLASYEAEITDATSIGAQALGAAKYVATTQLIRIGNALNAMKSDDAVVAELKAQKLTPVKWAVDKFGFTPNYVNDARRLAENCDVVNICQGSAQKALALLGKSKTLDCTPQQVLEQLPEHAMSLSDSKFKACLRETFDVKDTKDTKDKDTQDSNDTVVYVEIPQDLPTWVALIKSELSSDQIKQLVDMLTA